MPNVKKPHICVVGAGIIGLSSAYALAVNYPGCSITIIADIFSPNTVSNHSFGSIWIPNALESYSGPADAKRILSTYHRCLNIVTNFPDLAKEVGFEINSGFHVSHRKIGFPEQDSPIFMNTIRNFKRLDADSLKNESFLSQERLKNFENIFKTEDVRLEDLNAYSYDMIAINCDLYLPWMIREMELMVAKNHIKGFKMEQKRIKSLDELLGNGYDVIINCSGLGAKKLCNDDRMLPIRGQYLECKRPSNSSPFYASAVTLLFPISDKVLVGSIFQSGRDDTVIDDRDTKDIIERAKAFWPDIEQHVTRVMAEIRPGRKNGHRLEAELLRSEIPGVKSIPIIHNYGHGPKGIMLHWGCATDVVKLSKQFLRSSKL